ncbi:MULTISPECIES: recombinase family protein [Bacillota]|uniref:Serine recombinase n=2 Tax=Clostridiaceae TaxID=31979 RepID=V7IAH5_9CLOT|nr:MULTISPECIES: recombinase family protein [Bacillota]EAD1415562.1 recombinase family protein [Listeria monocytogenes]EAD1416044.1 recombinase family protein [Listeria monocytogenes]EAD3992246.1 recombinase family protein [Listeria monocytogenes]EAD4039540.1 recombinase family protein [Listeria monocytogenes]EAD4832690.1 recombinase family protein [Listeria monocytogenes]
MAEKNITVIPARKRVGSTAAKEKVKKLRVAAYCRVSTETEEQNSSYEVQVAHYTEFIKKNAEWEFAGIFADDGISGTNTKKREEFNRMIDECMEGNIDLVITKSISRFARNTLDCLKYIRQLKDKNIAVFFEKENINTMDAKGEVLLTIMASLAQQESQSLSQNVKLGLQYRYQQGKVQVNHNRFMGYTKDEEGNLIIVPEEAEIIKRIYREYLEGKSLAGIGRDLEKDGILTAAGKPRWRPETIKKILMNEKYIGDALLQKTFTVDFLTKKRVKNEGHVPQYYVENSHEAIIPKELFLQAQEELHRRNNIYTGADKNKRLYSSKYALSTITFCGDCGDIYRRVYWNVHGRKEFVWRCVTRIEQGPETCKNRTVKEGDLYDAVMTAINKLLAGGDNMIRTLEENIHAVIGDTTEYKISEINTLLEEKQKEVINLANKGKDYEFLADEIDKLREERQSLLVEDASLSGENERINELIEIIRKNKYRTLLYDDTLVRKLIQNVTVYEDHFVISFKSGIEIEV